jgi:hypothetical protein
MDVSFCDGTLRVTGLHLDVGLRIPGPLPRALTPCGGVVERSERSSHSTPPESWPQICAESLIGSRGRPVSGWQNTELIVGPERHSRSSASGAT